MNLRTIFLASLLGAGCLTANSAVAGLIAHWKFDETNGTTAIDSAGSTPGTLTGTVAVGQPGIDGYAYRFDGGHVAMGNVSFLSDILRTGGAHLNTFTFSAWVNHTMTGNASVVFAGSNAHSDRYANMALSNTRARYWHRPAANDTYVNPAEGSLNDGQWHHLAWVVTPTGSTLYIDGASRNTSSVNYPAIQDANNFELGRLGRSSPTDLFRGLMDDVRIYNHSLSGDEVADLHAAFVPEPSAIVLLVLGIGLLVGRRALRR
jgi:hypothetical protein